MTLAPSASPGARPRVVVCGAGFAGLWAARALARTEVDVLLLDRFNYHTFFPLLYQVAAAELGPTGIAYPVRSILRKMPNVRFRMAEVTGLDLNGRTVLAGGDGLPYDYLLVGLGSVPNYFGVEGAAKHAFPLRDMSQALPLRQQILSRFEAAEVEDDPTRRRRFLTFVIVGGGATGVEFAGALAELVYGPLLEDFPGVAEDEVAIVLLEAGDRVLAGMPDGLGEYAVDRLRRRRVEVRFGARVIRVGPEGIHLAEGPPLATETVVWTAGVQGDPRVADWGLPVTRGGRVPVTGALHLGEHPEVFVAGDLAWLTDDEGAPLPQVAQVALQQGRHAALNVLRAVRGHALRPFRYRDPGMLAVIGRNAAVAHLRGRSFKGFAAWILWLVIHIAYLIGFRNRALVLVNWAWNYIRFEHAVRLILPSAGGEMRGEGRGSTGSEPGGEPGSEPGSEPRGEPRD
ncbi:MAG TPA: NAD(P)/FAD-dependent oxidoreductase [Longimicrobiales bacterium]|jgi:NADH dehydrogenase